MSIYFNFYTNIFFLLPVLAAWYEREVIYLGLAIAIMIMSTVFHFLELRRHVLFYSARKLDISIATICYGYMIYFSLAYLTIPYLCIALSGLALSLATYGHGASQQSKEKEHIWHGAFHIVIGFVSATIVLFK